MGFGLNGNIRRRKKRVNDVIFCRIYLIIKFILKPKCFWIVNTYFSNVNLFILSKGEQKKKYKKEYFLLYCVEK